MIEPTASVPLNMTCQIAGWGATRFEGEISQVLKVANVTILDRTRCKNIYKDMSENVLCAGTYTGGTDSCQVGR